MMEITETRYQQIGHCMPRRRDNVSLADLQVLNAIFTLPGAVACGAEFPGISTTGPTYQTALDPGDLLVVQPKSNRSFPWKYGPALYRKRNEVEHLFRWLKGFRCMFSCSGRIDVVFLFLIYFAIVFEALKL